MNIGFIGLGNMGRPMASNLLKAGHALTVHDINRHRATELLNDGAMWADTAHDAAAAGTLTFTALPGPTEIEAALLGPTGALNGMQSGDTYIDVSTSTPESIQRIAAAAALKGVDVLDSPVSGGTRGARLATLVLMVGGQHDVYERCVPVLEHLGSKVVYMGPLGTGYVTKLVNNYIGMTNAIASMEAMVVGTKAGVAPQALLEVVNAGTGASHMTQTLYPFLIFGRNFEPTRFSMELGAKDFRLAVELAHALGVPVRLGDTVAAALDDAVTQGLGPKDFSTYITLLEKVAGVEVRG